MRWPESVLVVGVLRPRMGAGGAVKKLVLVPVVEPRSDLRGEAERGAAGRGTAVPPERTSLEGVSNLLAAVATVPAGVSYRPVMPEEEIELMLGIDSNGGKAGRGRPPPGLLVALLRWLLEAIVLGTPRLVWLGDPLE